MKSFTQYLNDVPNEDEGIASYRINQPQINDTNSFLSDLKLNGINFTHQRVDTNTLIPTQCEFNDDKVCSIVDNVMQNDAEISPIIISSDDYVIDGHHRWLAADAMGDRIDTIKVHLPLETLHWFLKNKPYVENKSINEKLEFTPVDDDYLAEAIYNGHKVQLYKPHYDTYAKSHKYKVYVRDGNKVRKIGFGSKQTRLNRYLKNKIHNAKKKLRCSQRSNRASKGYWSCRMLSRNVTDIINETLLEGYYIDTIKRQLIDYAKLRLNIADVSGKEYSDALIYEVNRIADLDADAAFAEYSTRVVNNEIYDKQKLYETYTDWTHNKFNNKTFKDVANELHTKYMFNRSMSGGAPHDYPNTHEVINAWRKRRFDMTGQHDAPNDDSADKLSHITRPEVFSQMLNDSDHRLNVLAAKHGGEAIHKEAQHHNIGMVRAMAAQSKSTHAVLKDDISPMVRHAVAVHSDDIKVLKKLAKDPDIRVAQAAVGRANEINHPDKVQVHTMYGTKHGRPDVDHSNINLSNRPDLRNQFDDDIKHNNLTRSHQVADAVGKVVNTSSFLSFLSSGLSNTQRRRR